MNDKTFNYLAATHNVSKETVAALFEAFQQSQDNTPWNEKFKEVASMQLELESRISFYNTVKQQTLNKFNGLSSNHLELIELPLNARLYALSRADKTFYLASLPDNFVLQRTDVLHFSVPDKTNSFYKRTIKVPASLLWNDPIAVSQYVRREVRFAQAKQAAAEKKTVTDKTRALKSQLAMIQRDLAAAEAREKVAGEFEEKRAKWRERRTQQKLARKARKQETVSS